MNKLPDSDPVYAIVATVRALLLVELQSKNVTPLEWSRPEYYGISWRPDGQNLILSHSMLDNSALIDVPSYALSETGVLSEGESITQPFLSQPHQLVVGSDGRIICTNTGRNSIAIFDFARPNLLQEAKISSARWDRLSLRDVPGDHLNSVFEKDGVLYVIAHRHGKGSALATFSLPDLELIAIEPVKNRSGLHNIWVTDDGQRITCHSEAGSLIDLNSNATLWDSGSPVYTRGIAASADFVLVGESQKTERASRRHSMSGLWLLDRKTWQALDYFCLGSYGAVHEVRLLNIKDEAHHGYLFNGLDALLKRDERVVAAAQRLNASYLAQHTKTMWTSFDLLFGSPVAVENGGLTAAPENLSLLVHNAQNQPDQELDFSYALDHPTGESHLAVVAYRGQGGDTDMDAIMIERATDSAAQISRWVHDGHAWNRRSGTAVDGLPLSGKIRFMVTPGGIEMRINDRRLSGGWLDDFPAASGSIGIRWLGATIRPA